MSLFRASVFIGPKRGRSFESAAFFCLGCAGGLPGCQYHLRERMGLGGPIGMRGRFLIPSADADGTDPLSTHAFDPKLFTATLNSPFFNFRFTIYDSLTRVCTQHRNYRLAGETSRLRLSIFRNLRRLGQRLGLRADGY